MEEELKAYENWWAKDASTERLWLTLASANSGHGLPTVVIEQKLMNATVIGDGEQMVRLLALRQPEQGCRHIAFVCGSSSFTHIQQRIATLHDFGQGAESQLLYRGE